VSVINPGFEDGGAFPGMADGWQPVVAAVGFEVADIGEPDGWPGVERFEGGWSNEDWSAVFSGDPATFGADDEHDGFEYGWGNENWSTTLISVEEFPDTFETGWSNEDWQDTFGPTDVEAAQFDAGTPEPVEDFEEEWSNDTWQGTFGLGDITACQFDGTPEPVEDFEEEWPDVVMQTI
jgi:hypothetical protein